MITRGSKFFYGAGVVGLLMALLYGFITSATAAGGVTAALSDGGVVESVLGPLSAGWKGGVGDHIGYTVLLAFAGVMFAVGGFHTALRDGDAEAAAEIQGVQPADLPAATAPFGASYWPIVAAFGAGLLAVGLTFNEWLGWAGLIVLVVAGFEWTVRSWSERATGDPALNAAYRNKILRPLEVPIGAVLVLGLVGIAVSRILLAVPKVGATFLIIIVAAILFGLFNFLARRPTLRREVVLWVVLVGAVLVIGAGIAAGIAGPREIEKHGSEHGAATVAVDTTGTSGY